MGNRYFYHPIPEFIHQQDFSIAHYEMLAIIILLKLWATAFKGQKIKLSWDNEVVVSVVNSSKARDQFLQAALRGIVFISAQHDFWVKLVYIPTKKNIILDLLSRAFISKHALKKFAEITKHRNMIKENVNDEMFDFTHEW